MLSVIIYDKCSYSTVLLV